MLNFRHFLLKKRAILQILRLSSLRQAQGTQGRHTLLCQGYGGLMSNWRSGKERIWLKISADISAYFGCFIYKMQDVLGLPQKAQPKKLSHDPAFAFISYVGIGPHSRIASQAVIQLQGLSQINLDGPAHFILFHRMVDGYRLIAQAAYKYL